MRRRGAEVAHASEGFGRVGEVADTVVMLTEVIVAHLMHLLAFTMGCIESARLTRMLSLIRLFL